MTKNTRLKNRDSKGKHLSTHPSLPIVDDEAKPLFSLEYITCNKYNLRYCDVKDKAIFLEAIHKRSRLTWKDIKDLPYKNGLGWEPLKDERLNIKLRKMTEKTLTEDTKIWVFCAKSRTKRRILGQRDGQIFYILFLDPKGKLYKH